MSWYQRKRDELGMFILREYPSTLEECFQSPVEGAIYAELIDKLRAEGAIRPGNVDRSALVHTCWDLGSPVNTCVWFFQVVAGEIRVIDLDIDLDLTPVERVLACWPRDICMAVTSCRTTPWPHRRVGERF